FSRVEWQIAITNDVYKKIAGKAEDNWVWSPSGVVDMHRPEMWGVVQFTGRPAKESLSVAPIAGKSARDLVLEDYYAQRDFWKQHGRWATNLTELTEAGWSSSKLSPGVSAPILESSSDGYTCSATFDAGGHQRTWRIRQDRLLTLDEPLPLESETFITK